MVTFAHDGPGTSAEEWAAHPGMSELRAWHLGDDVERLVVVAAHPDDESLGAGGLMGRVHQRGGEVIVVAASHGEGSHPNSVTHRPSRLASLRQAELRNAVDAVAPGAPIHALGLPDGQVADHENDVLIALVKLIGDGARTLVVAPWRHDGHPDHEAAGRAAVAAAARSGAGLLEYPIWFWHWGRPDEAPWDRLQLVRLDRSEALAKAEAQSRHRSQVEPLSGERGDEALLDVGFLEHFTGPREIYIVESPEDDALDDLHAEEAEPWGADSRWYEKRKRSLLLSALPRATFRHGLELGSSTGVLAEELATRCTDLLVVDSSPHAVRAARSRLRALDGVSVAQMVVPREWPTAPPDGFDLVVLSEIGYFLSPRDLDDTVERIRAGLADDGVVVLCHWRHEVVGWPMDGPDAHRRVVAAGLRPVIAEYRDRDFELLVLALPRELPDPAGR